MPELAMSFVTITGDDQELAEAKSDTTNTARNAWANVHAARSNMFLTFSSPC